MSQNSEQKTALRIKKRRAVFVISKLKKLFPEAQIQLHFKSTWELVVAVILSAQCTDKKVNEVTAQLFKKYRTLEDYVNANRHEFEKDIYQTGFYRAKTDHILKAARTIKEKMGCVVPNTMEELLSLPGVGRKTANVILGNAFGKSEGIVVDTHVMRLAKKMDLSHGKNAVAIEKDLMKIIPKKEWISFSHLMIAYGRSYCPARRHDHKKCPIQ